MAIAGEIHLAPASACLPSCSADSVKRPRISANKFHAEAYGCYDSGLERRRHEYLKLREKAGEIEDVLHHPARVCLDPEAQIHYSPDFSYTEDGRTVWEETKGGRATSGGRWPTVAKLWRAHGPGLLLVVEWRGGCWYIQRRIMGRLGE
jgi:hypothetical protein